MAQDTITQDFEYHDPDSGLTVTGKADWLVASEWWEAEYAPYGSTDVQVSPAGWVYNATLKRIHGLTLDANELATAFGLDQVRRWESLVEEELADKQEPI